jgi:pimeloyl-ACP methyl ester carboxylesterase
VTTWVFLRGLTRESRHWGSFVEVFRGAVPDARVVLLDLPGNGRLNGERSPASVARMAAFCRVELLRQRVEPPYYVLAMSLGAMVAAEWAATHPEELRGCVLINTSLRPFSPLRQRLRPETYGPLLALALLGGIHRHRETTILRLTSARKDQHAEVLQRWLQLRRERPVSRANALRQMLAAAGYRAPELAPRTPMLLLASARDRLVDPGCSKAIAEAWRSALAIHPESGHDLPLDDPEWVAAQIRSWLDAAGTDGTSAKAEDSGVSG